MRITSLRFDLVTPDWPGSDHPGEKTGDRSGSYNRQARRPLKGATRAALALVVLAPLMTGCTMSRTLTLDSTEPTITASIAKPIKEEGIDATDAELIKTVVADTEPDELAERESNLLAWSNPDTGNHGTIMAIDRFIGESGQPCKKFRTTVDGFNGIALYKGETCATDKNDWVLSWFSRDRDE